MADELNISFIARYNDGTTLEDVIKASFLPDLSTLKKTGRVVHAVGTSEEAMLLGEVTSLGYCAIINYGPTNFVQIRTATSGTAMVKIPAGEGAIFRFGSGVTAPFIVADTAGCTVEYCIYST